MEQRYVLYSKKKTKKYFSILSLTVALSSAFALQGCGIDPREINTVPFLSPVHADLGYQKNDKESAYAPPKAESNYSLYRNSANSFFKDPRAMRPGDILTVMISINDRANMNNKSDLKKDSDAKYEIGGGYSLFSKIGGSLTGSTGAHAKGDAKVQRNEDIRLSVAAIVTDVLPNGNLIIRGSQEVRVNYELRVLNIAGIVRPRDIAGDNTIAYDKIAEARISYGGRGRMSDLQQPPYGQQLMNQIAPF